MFGDKGGPVLVEVEVKGKEYCYEKNGDTQKSQSIGEMLNRETESETGHGGDGHVNLSGYGEEGCFEPTVLDDFDEKAGTDLTQSPLESIDGEEERHDNPRGSGDSQEEELECKDDRQKSLEVVNISESRMQFAAVGEHQ